MKKVLLLMSLMVLFLGCQKSLTEKEVKVYKEKGAEISQKSYQKLSSALKQSMKEGGITDAIKYCNSAALPLTEEMSDTYQVTIKRTALRTRNVNNSPDKEELAILNYYKELIEKGTKIESVVQLDNNNNPHFYAPIIMQKKCLACHGRLDQEVSSTTDSIIKSYYPNDIAMGFQEDELRGIWSITFLSEK